MNLIEPDLDVIGQIVDRYNDHSSEAWSRYHETGRGQLKMSFWDNHHELMFIVNRYRVGTVFDYGCGTGHLDVHLAKEGFKVLGYDPNETNREVARYVADIQPQSIKDKIIIIDTPPKDDEVIDVIWICHTLEHVSKDDWKDFFKPVVCGGWYVLISVPLGRAYYVPSHVNIWNSESELVQDLSNFGLTVAWYETDRQNSVIRVELIP